MELAGIITASLHRVPIVRSTLDRHKGNRRKEKTPYWFQLTQQSLN
jgi:hypothetical protein